MEIDTVWRWEDCPPVTKADTAVVFDVLRATTSMVYAAAAGVVAIRPVDTVEEARRYQARYPGWWLAGERANLRPAGFDRGNSALEWSDPVPPGTQVVWTTTNGTRALSAVREAGQVITGAFVNAGAVAEHLGRVDAARSVLVAAGTKGGFSLEDWLAAGAVAEALGEWATWTDATRAAVLAFRAAKDRLYSIIQSGTHARALEAMGLGEDVRYAAMMSSLHLVLVRGEDGCLRPQ